jgi:aminomethyltransferase
MVPFAGYEMPVQYRDGIIAEHRWTRESAGLFDVSHMGQAFLTGPDRATTIAALERLVPGDIAGLELGRMRYTQLTNPGGGVIDDLMVIRSRSPADDASLGLVVNASRKAADHEWIAANLPPGVKLVAAEDRGLLALQGPKAAEVLARHAPKSATLAFMSGTSAEFDGIDCHISRSGYTGEDGFEISVPASRIRGVAQALLGHQEVKPIGLGARDSLRLEAGLCLYGHELDETTSPVEAGLVWSIGKRRRSDGGFIGFERIERELREGPKRKLVGIRPEGRGPAREGAEIFSPGRERVGKVTSGLFSPTIGGPISLGYVETAFAKPGTALSLMVREKPIAAKTVALPFVAHRYKR